MVVGCICSMVALKILLNGGIKMNRKLQVFIFSYFLAGVLYVIGEHLYALLRNEPPTFSVILDIVLISPFWPLVPTARLFGVVIMLASVFLLYKKNFVEKTEGIIKIGILFFVVSLFTLVGLYLWELLT